MGRFPGLWGAFIGVVVCLYQRREKRRYGAFKRVLRDVLFWAQKNRPAGSGAIANIAYK